MEAQGQIDGASADLEAQEPPPPRRRRLYGSRRPIREEYAGPFADCTCSDGEILFGFLVLAVWIVICMVMYWEKHGGVGAGWV